MVHQVAFSLASVEAGHLSANVTAKALRGHCHVGECRRLGRIGGVSTATASYKGHRYPVEIINHCVWLYFRFPLSFREVEELMLRVVSW